MAFERYRVPGLLDGIPVCHRFGGCVSPRYCGYGGLNPRHCGYSGGVVPRAGLVDSVMSDLCDRQMMNFPF